jgi:peptidoglycan/xylan/chitin deacetylase (PgdA/CDA1 family)
MPLLSKAEPFKNPKLNPTISELTPENSPLILMYHDVLPPTQIASPPARSTKPKPGTLEADPIATSTVAFEEQMKELQKQGYVPISMEDLYAARTSGKKLAPKSVLITFDDGYLGQFLHALPILKKYQMKATFFVATDLITEKGHADTPWKPHMSWSQLNEIEDREKNGDRFQIYSHSHKHLGMYRIANDKLVSELRQSREMLESKLSRKDIVRRFFAYPGGHFSAPRNKRHPDAPFTSGVLERTAEFYDMAMTTYMQPHILSQAKGSNFAIERADIKQSHATIKDFLKRIEDYAVVNQKGAVVDPSKGATKDSNPKVDSAKHDEEETAHGAD